MNYLVFDTETSGLDCKKNQILTAYFIVLNEKWEKIDDLSLQIKPDTSKYIMDEEALKVTKLDLNYLATDSKSLTMEQAGDKLLELLEKHKIPKARKHFRPVGHNVEFDIKFITEQLLKPADWFKYVHYNTLDTLRVVTFLQDIGFLPERLGRLDSLVEYFGLNKDTFHEAKSDVEMTIQVYISLKNMMLGMKSNTFVGKQLLEIIEL